MATVTRGARDALVKKFAKILGEYERENPGAVATVYRQNSAAIRVRVVDERFARMSKPDRHDRVWRFISDRLSDDEIQELSILLLLSPAEQRSSFLNAEFDDPVPSSL
jgi:stress-induced morphogen